MTDHRRLDSLLETGAALLKASGAREVYVFGSVATGRAHAASDIDLAVSGLPPETFFETMAHLSDLFQTPFDLIDLDQPSPFTAYLRERGLLRRVA